MILPLLILHRPHRKRNAEDAKERGRGLELAVCGKAPTAIASVSSVPFILVVLLSHVKSSYERGLPSILAARCAVLTRHRAVQLELRPFYLLAALLAALSVPVWTAEYFGVLPAGGYLTGVVWHAHGVMFGFAVAVITGFLFTAVRNWTGLPTPLVATWPCSWASLCSAPVTATDFVALPLVLAAANLGFHVAQVGMIPIIPLVLARFALYPVLIIVTIMAGRVIPSFTQNAIPLHASSAIACLISCQSGQRRSRSAVRWAVRQG